MSDLIVRRRDEQWILQWHGGSARIAIGRGGVGMKNGEGDGVTPVGAWPLRRVLYRPDRVAPPKTSLPVATIGPDDGWCDEPGDRRYNQQVKLPYPASAETMWRDDGLYDIVLVVGFNDTPAVPGAGSAIFVHLAQPDYAPTEGCVALAKKDFLPALEQLVPENCLLVTA